MSGFELARDTAAWSAFSMVPQHSNPQFLIRRGFTTLLSIFFCTNNSHGANVSTLSNIRPGIALSICLTKNEVKELTLKAHYAAQARTLSEMGIRFTLRPDGSPVVLHSTLREMTAHPERKLNQPDFSSLDH